MILIHVQKAMHMRIIGGEIANVDEAYIFTFDLLIALRLNTSNDYVQF